MYLSTQLPSVCAWIFLVFLLCKNRVASRSAQQTSRLSKQNTQARNLKMIGEKNYLMLDQAKNDPQQAISCNCRDFCPDPNSSELQVSWSFVVLKMYKNNIFWA